MAQIAPQLRPEELLDDIYGAVAERGRWTRALDRVCTALDGRMAALGSIDERSRKIDLAAIVGEAALTAPLLERYMPDVPFFTAAASMETDVAYTVDAVYALQGPGARSHWLESRMVPEWVVPNGLDDFFWLSMSKGVGRNGVLFVLTGNTRRPISGYDLAWAEALSPHMRRAVAIADLFEAERAETRIFRRLVEALAHPVIVVATDMRILFANAAAEALFGDGAVVGAARGRLNVPFAHADAAIARAVAVGERNEFELGAAGVNVPLCAGARAAVAHVLPLARREPEVRLAQGAAAAIFVGVAGAPPLAAIDAIADLFGLTPAEKRVAAHVADGMSRRDIAAAQGVSDGTVKSQLGAIFDKTGVHDQRHLELLIKEISPPVLARPHES